MCIRNVRLTGFREAQLVAQKFKLAFHFIKTFEKNYINRKNNGILNHLDIDTSVSCLT